MRSVELFPPHVTIEPSELPVERNRNSGFGVVNDEKPQSKQTNVLGKTITLGSCRFFKP